MATATMAERMTIARLAMAMGVRGARAALAWPARRIADVSARGPRALAIAPQDIRTTDPTIADDIYAGHFHFAGRIVESHGGSPFDFAEAPPEWETALMGFAWLRHLRAAETALARANARALIDEWMTLQGRRAPARNQSIAWRPQVAARRLISFISHSPLLLEGADVAFYRRFMRAIGQHVSFLQRQVADGLGGEARLVAVLALMQASLCANGLENTRRRFGKLLVSTLQAQILPDGGHVSRNPQILVDLLLDLLPLRQAFAARGLSIPQELISCVDRVMPMLRMMRHADATLALFNGMGVTAPDTIATVLAYDDARAQPVLNAHYSGYQRLEAAGSIVVCDAGAPPPPELSSRAHAGALSFEFSSDGQRIIVNCGAPAQTGGPLREASRLTAAHSTLAVADASSCRFGQAFGNTGLARATAETLILAGPSTVDVRRSDADGAAAMEASHDGYAARYGVVHRRQLTLAADGWRLDGIDTLAGRGRTGAPGPVDYALRFHLHPQARAGLVEHGQGVLIALPGGEAWIFHASGLALELEESVFLAGFDGPRTTSQIVVRGNAATQSEVAWALSRSQ